MGQTLRTFPIRVGGNSGPIKDEITWEEVQQISGAPQVHPEYTSVTKRQRRVGRFDLDAVKKACLYNRPTSLAVMGIDRLDYRNHKVDHPSMLTMPAKTFLGMLERETKICIGWVGTGFGSTEAFQHSVQSHELPC